MTLLTAPVDTRPLAPRTPLELIGHRRDEARLLVAWRSSGQIVEARMADLAAFLGPGDVVVVNNSTTRPAALVVDDDLVVHLSTELEPGRWTVELRHIAGAGTTAWLDFQPPHGPSGHAAGENGPISLPGGGQLRLIEPYAPAHRPGQPVRLWVADLTTPGSLDEYLARHGRPIRYGADVSDWPLSAYQTVFARVPGSAEMPSAARGFTPELVTRLVSKGVTLAPITLFTGVASQDAGEPPYAEHYSVPQATADAVNAAHAAGNRVIAIGTTATRALESVARHDGTVVADEGWTELVITPERGAHTVDGLLTGWHDPEASHLLLVEAIAGRSTLDRSYEAAVEARFAGHEFGDFHLILP